MCLGLSAAPPLVSHGQASAAHLLAATPLLGLVDHASCQGKQKTEFQKFCDVIWQQTRGDVAGFEILPRPSEPVDALELIPQQVPHAPRLLVHERVILARAAVLGLVQDDHVVLRHVLDLACMYGSRRRRGRLRNPPAPLGTRRCAGTHDLYKWHSSCRHHRVHIHLFTFG